MHRNPTILYTCGSNSLYDMEYIIYKMLYTCSCGFMDCQLQHCLCQLPEIYFVSYYMLVSVVFSRNDYKDIVIWLVNECQCDPNVRNNNGDTLLHTACR